MGSNIWSAYVRAVSPRAERQEDIAAKIGVKQATVSRWLTGKSVPDEGAPVAAFAKAYGRNVLEAFVAAGLLTEEDAGRGLPVSSRRFLAGLRDAATSSDGAVYDAIRRNPRLGNSLSQDQAAGLDQSHKRARRRS